MGNAYNKMKNKNTVVQAKTADYTLQEHLDMGAPFSNNGAAAAVAITLLEAKVGMEHCFYVEEAQTLQITPYGTETIALPKTGKQGAAGIPIEADVVGALVKIKCVTDGQWEIETFVGDWEFPEIEDADGVTVTAAQDGTRFNNRGALGAGAFVLPAATVGLSYRFNVKVAQELRITPDGTETIALPDTGVQGAASKYLTANAVGEFVVLKCETAGQWEVVYFGGTWTAEA